VATLCKKLCHLTDKILNLFTVLTEKGVEEVNEWKQIRGKEMNHEDAREINVWSNSWASRTIHESSLYYYT
jgi:hypothetical protein